ncbi:MAG: 1,4-alpha-glucan branching protein GlgB [Erysipelotrichaceae bacterium]
MDKYLNFQEEISHELYKYFGAHIIDGGVVFRVYAPNALNVSVAGDFNNWNYKLNYLNRLSENGVFEIFIEGISQWSTYKYGIFTTKDHYTEKSDPFGFYHELRPNHASKIVDINEYSFSDDYWLSQRNCGFNKALNIYELHVGSWFDSSDYVDLAFKLVPYLKKMAYNYVELMPITEYPFDGSWGYQVTGFYSITSRYGSLNQFKEFVNILHQNNIGVILDVVPAHFVKDNHGLRLFDGSTLYQEAQESQWGTLYFDYSKIFVQNFFISSVAYFFDVCHIDGVRMDAISNLIYYHGRKDFGLNSNGISFLKNMNQKLKDCYPDCILIAEDSSDYSGVTNTIAQGGLGFDYKWDLGWMNDTLKYYQLDPIHKSYHHYELTFSMDYFFSERFIMPLSHDEVVHGKKTIIDKMWGTYDEKFSLAKNLYAYMFTHPGKKLNFMGNELAHFREWDENKNLDWFLLDYPKHHSFKRYIQDLNQLYLNHDALFAYDYQSEGFRWLDVNRSDLSIFSYLRISASETLIVVLNMTKQEYPSYHIPVPNKGKYQELLNSENEIYGGSNITNANTIETIEQELMGYSQYIDICIAPYAAIIFKII